MIFVLSDTHVPDKMEEIPRKLIKLIRQEDIIFHAGDFVGWEFFSRLANLATIYAVRGNMDSAEIGRFLPEKKVVEIKGKKIGITHGSGSSVKLAERVYRELGSNCDVSIFGHSHAPYNRKMGDTLLFNPGSVSGNMTPPFGATYGVLTIEGGDVWAEVVDL
jgi:putative phosphoesterase